MSTAEALERVLPLAEGFVRGMHQQPDRYPKANLDLAVKYLVEARRALGWPVPAEWA